MNDLCDDTLARVISFLDFKSAIVASKLTSNRVRHDCSIAAVSNENTTCIDANADAVADANGYHLDSTSSGDENNTTMDTINATNEEGGRDENGSYYYGRHCFQQLWKQFYQRQLFPPLDYYKYHHSEGTGTAFAHTTVPKQKGDHNVCSSNNTRQPPVDYIQLCKKKRKLFSNLMQQRTTKRKSNGSTNIKSCFSIPNRCFQFVPIQPSYYIGADAVNDANADIHQQLNPDPPPVDFQCPSYILTSLSTGGEYVFLDPFDGSLSVHSDIMAHVVPKTCIDFELGLGLDLDLNLDMGMEAENCENAKKCQSISTHTSCSETLFSVQDYFQLDLHEYFQPQNPLQRQDHLRQRDQHRHPYIELAQDNEIEVGWMGIDSHVIIDEEENMVGNMIFAARELSADRNDFFLGQGQEHAPMGEFKSCTELLAWKKSHHNGNYGKRYTCRMDGTPYFMEVCAVKEVVYACFSPGRSDPYGDVMERNERNSNGAGGGDGIEDAADFDDNGFAIKHNNQIRIFSLIENDDEHMSGVGKRQRYFPDLQETISCSNPVTSFVSESTGSHLIVGTDNGVVEIWNVQAEAYLCERINIRTRMRAMAKARTLAVQPETKIEIDEITRVNEQQEQQCRNQISLEMDIDTNDCGSAFEDEGVNMIPFTDHRMPYASALDHLNETMQSEHDATEPDDYNDNGPFNVRGDVSMEQDDCDNMLSLSQCKLNRAINHIFLPKHLNIYKAGFVSMQHHKSEGTALMLWQYGKSGSFDIVSMVNLPLSTQRRPQVAYDGKRLVVFGQDHIGLIILVYRVLR